MSLGLWLMAGLFSLVTETTYSQIISPSSPVQTKNSVTPAYQYTLYTYIMVTMKPAK